MVRARRNLESTCQSLGNRIMTARQTAESRKTEALELIAQLNKLVADTRTDTDNWGVAGSLGHTVEQVSDAVQFLKGF
jgi:hypothetical protein